MDKRAVALAAGLAVVALAGCTSSGPAPEPTTSSAAPTPSASTSDAPEPTTWDKPSGLPLVKLGGLAWNGKQAGLRVLDSIDFVGDLAVVEGATSSDNAWHPKLEVVHAATGVPVWRRADGDPLAPGRSERWAGGDNARPVLLGSGDTFAVAWGDPKTGAAGVAALRTTDGAVVWSRRLVTTEPDRALQATAVVGVDAKRLYVMSGANAWPGVPAGAASHAYALDPGTGRVLWNRPGFSPGRLAGNRLIGTVPADSLKYGAPAAVSTDNGQFAWKLPPDHDRLDRGTFTSMTMYELRDGGQILHDEYRSNATGELLPCPTESDPGGGSFGADVAYWVDSDGHVESIEFGHCEIFSSALKLADAQHLRITGSVQGYAVLERIGDDDGLVASSTLTDRSGARLSSTIPGDVLALTDKYVVSTKTFDAFWVYRRA